jgi:DNA-binding CsgD family transcriptional regulator
MLRKADRDAWNAGIANTIEFLNTPAFESSLIHALKALADIDGAVFFIYRLGHRPEAVFDTLHPDQRVLLVDRYIDGPFILDPFYQACYNGTAPGLYSLRDLSPNRFRQSEYCRTFYGLVGISDEVCFILPPCGNLRGVISLTRLLPKAAFRSMELSGLSEAVPLVNALVHSAWKGRPENQIDHAPPEPASVSIETLFCSFRHSVLSPREVQVTVMILRGYSSAAIGVELGIAEATVKANRRNIYTKLRISSQAELFAFFLRQLSDAKDLYARQGNRVWPKCLLTD